MNTYSVDVCYMKNGNVNLQIKMRINAENKRQAERFAAIQWKGAEIKVIDEVHIYIRDGEWFLQHDETHTKLFLSEDEYDSDYVKCEVWKILGDSVNIICDLSKYEKFINDLRVHEKYFFGFYVHNRDGSIAKK